MRICEKHGTEMKRRNFDGYQICVKCALEASIRYRKKNPERVNRNNQKYNSKNKDKVRKWNSNKPLESRLLYGARARARKKGVPFTIDVNDVVVPHRCPYLGIPIFQSPKHCTDNSPSLDAIIPKLGYVPGNVEVISFRANTLKSNSTATELRLIADRLERMLEKAPPQVGN